MAHMIKYGISGILITLALSMMDAGYSGNDFTWTNNRRKRKGIRERLDRVFYNNEWSATFPLVNVRHLPRTGSDHNKLRMTCSIQDTPPIKYFKFLNFWTEQNDFQKIVQDSWDEEVTNNPMWIMQQKLKRLASSLNYWSRNTIGNMFDKRKDLEDKVEAMEAAYGEDNSDTNRINLNKLYATKTNMS
ncbi:uncharacterized protein LOC107778219 [Nicotiana tabacum]|uniref:Uncharacterized protein LOC107778219 n=1 Tax=Nicotiana tabacum TaxID=4097 RepID=A0AC58SEB9_TOBAC